MAGEKEAGRAERVDPRGAESRTGGYLLLLLQ